MVRMRSAVRVRQVAYINQTKRGVTRLVFVSHKFRVLKSQSPVNCGIGDYNQARNQQ